MRQEAISINQEKKEYKNMARNMVSIKFLGMQCVITKKDSVNIPFTEKMTVKDALEFVRHNYPDLDLDEGMIFITVNQEKTSLDRLLCANDTISFVPYISGG